MFILGGVFAVATIAWWTPATLTAEMPSEKSVAYVRDYIERSARDFGVSTTVALWIVKKESNFEAHRTGDDDKVCGFTGETQRSRGLWQISDCYHPEVSDECAYNVECSTKWSLRHIKRGYVREWSTYKFCRRWYKDCPF